MKRPRRVSTHLFSPCAWKAWLSLAFIVVCSLERVSMGLVSASLDVRIIYVYNLLSVPKFVLEALSACFVVDWIFKWFGHSSSGKVFETRGPRSRIPRRAAANQTCLNSPAPSQLLYTLPIVSAFFASALRLPDSNPVGEPQGRSSLFVRNVPACCCGRALPVAIPRPLRRSSRCPRRDRPSMPGAFPAEARSLVRGGNVRHRDLLYHVRQAKAGCACLQRSAWPESPEARHLFAVVG